MHSNHSVDGGIKKVNSATKVNAVDRTINREIKKEFHDVTISFCFVVLVGSFIIKSKALTYEHPPKRPTQTIIGSKP